MFWFEGDCRYYSIGGLCPVVGVSGGECDRVVQRIVPLRNLIRMGIHV